VGHVRADFSKERVASIFRADSLHPEDGGDAFLQNVGCNRHMESYPRRQNFNDIFNNLGKSLPKISETLKKIKKTHKLRGP
jgi:hypothetical protein